MLAIEPNAVVPTSVDVRPGTPTAAGPGIGQLDWDVFIPQPVVLDWVVEDPSGSGSRTLHRVVVQTVADLIRYTAAYFFDATVAQGIVKIDPADSTKFQLRRKLHIVFPADPANPTRVKRGRRLPIALLVHGNHSAVEGGRVVESHLGYDYLQQELADLGIVSVSVDTNAANAFNAWIDMRAESVLGALDQMHEMDADSTSIFHRRLDFNRVALMGHSRGGDAVVKAAILNAKRTTGKYNFSVVCSLAPTDFTGTLPSADMNSLHQSHTRFYAVLYGALDGDVHGCDFHPVTHVDRKASGTLGTGARHYDRANVAKAMVFFDECGHNRFNTRWPIADPVHYGSGTTTLRSEADHRSLAIEYIGGLFRWHLLGKATQSQLFEGSVSNKLSAGAAIQWSFPNAVSLEEFEPVGKAPPLAGALIDGTWQLPIENRTHHQTRVLVVKPVSVDSDVYPLHLSGAQSDWTRFTHFLFRVCADADVTSSATIATSPFPEFTLVFTDSDGQSHSVLGSSLRTAARPRRPVYHEVLLGTVRNATVIRFETFAIEVASLANVNVAALAKVTLRATTAISKDQFFDSFQLIKR